jgi:hypothetical protein
LDLFIAKGLTLPGIILAPYLSYYKYSDKDLQERKINNPDGYKYIIEKRKVVPGLKIDCVQSAIMSIDNIVFFYEKQLKEIQDTMLPQNSRSSGSKIQVLKNKCFTDTEKIVSLIEHACAKGYYDPAKELDGYGFKFIDYVEKYVPAKIFGKPQYKSRLLKLYKL